MTRAMWYSTDWSRARSRTATATTAAIRTLSELARSVPVYDPGVTRDLLLERLHEIHDAHGQIRHRDLATLCAEMRIPLAEGYEVATFYHRLGVVRDDAAPADPAPVRVCDGVPCLVRGARDLGAGIERATDRSVRWGPCIGQCDRAPAIEVGAHVVAPATADAAAEAVRNGNVRATPPEAVAFDAYVARGGYALLRSCLAGERDPEGVIATLDQAGLRGLGGAGFPTARKWRTVRSFPGPRYVVLNADEGEPGTFKDRWCFEADPHRVLEGLLIGCWAVGARECYVYLRDEYAGIRAMLAREIAALDAGRVSPVRIHLRRGAGAYVCGEESAMLESIEGRRGYPRHRPPYAAEVGLFGRPTLIQNVETMYWVPEILSRGPEWWRSHGRQGRGGLRLFSLSGRVRRPGVYVAPAGISVRELIDQHGGGMEEGHALAAYLPGGAAGGILPASLDGLPLDFDTLQAHGAFIGSAAVIVLSDRDDVAAVARELMRFFRDESCGQCAPCRVGTEKALTLMNGPRWNVPLVRELSATMADASICGLGQAAPNPVLSVLRFWPEAVGAERSP
jgi:formate dehydrogenase